MATMPTILIIDSNAVYREALKGAIRKYFPELTVKEAEDGDGIILRLIETEGDAVEATVSVPIIEIDDAYRTNLVEENEEKLPVERNTITVAVGAFGITTIRIRGISAK